MDIGGTIKKIRKHKNLSQGKLAEKVGITNSYLSSIENNKVNCSMDTLQTIAKKLKVPLTVVMWYATEEADISVPKVKHFRDIKPHIDRLISEVFIIETR